MPPPPSMSSCLLRGQLIDFNWQMLLQCSSCLCIFGMILELIFHLFQVCPFMYNSDLKRRISFLSTSWWTGVCVCVCVVCVCVVCVWCVYGMCVWCVCVWYVCGVCVVCVCVRGVCAVCVVCVCGMCVVCGSGSVGDCECVCVCVDTDGPSAPWGLSVDC